MRGIDEMDNKRIAKYKDADELLKRLNSCKYPAEKTTMRQATYNAAISDACRIVDAIPVVYIPQWIPVKDKLPEEICNSYWICTDSGYQCECRWTNINPFWSNLTTSWHWNIFDIPQYTTVVAWMPLPKPYKEGEQNE